MSMPICSCAEFYGEHHPDCPVRARIAALEAVLKEARDYVVAEAESKRSLYQPYPTLHRKFRADDELLARIDALLEGK